MNKYIAVGAALAVLSAALFLNPSAKAPSDGSEEGLALPSFEFAMPALKLPGASSAAVGAEAFDTFKRYIAFAGQRNIEGVKSLSHQVSGACSDPDRLPECEGLMDSVYYFGQVFKEDDFKHVFYDDRQIVMLTDFIKLDHPDFGDSPVKLALFFTRLEDGSPRVLGIKFCAPGGEESSCFQTDPSKRDSDQNGWWDQVEALFKRAG